MLFSEQRKELMVAFLKAQSEFGPIQKSGYNPHFKSNYSTVEDYQKSCMSALRKYGLTCNGGTDIIEGQFVVTVDIHHADSGQWMRSIAPVTPDKPGPQPIGCWISYLTRYMMGRMLGVYGDEGDDDGNSQHELNCISNEQFQILVTAIKSHPNAKKILNDILSFNKIQKLEELPESSFFRVKSYIEKSRES
jgi:hypothetical protein